MSDKLMIQVAGLSKGFTLHTQGGAEIPVFADLQLQVAAGECLCLHGPSGSGKSTLLRSLYGNYRVQQGQILLRYQQQWIDLATAEPFSVLRLRRAHLGYVSQFLRVIPRVSSLDLVAQSAMAGGLDKAQAYQRAQQLLARLSIPERLWQLAPATFSGGEQQRVNIARGFAIDYPILLLDEPTASLDAKNRQIVIQLINEAKARGAALVGIFHDDEVREAVADRLLPMRAPLQGVA